MLLHDWWAPYHDVPHVCWFSLLQPEDHSIFCTSQAAGCCVRCWWSVYFLVSITYLYVFGKNVQCTLTIIKIICRYAFLSSGEWLLPLLRGRDLHRKHGSEWDVWPGSCLSGCCLFPSSIRHVEELYIYIYIDIDRYMPRILKIV